ncbi:aldehyde dehydrogenase family protein [Ramlibacter sp. WS9]|uniref:aldehyde dehydrogenase family protein n=1 Tax=Ramlibacter sp. WS9 TaxID=1882741 RepID=UPI0011449983|nr:aldehyde dehydrogenase family protein [Ramlibacter sp. WS9]ROZ78066.1 aldehyde dehydrogenase family protein [Ramlibacter sp. WS9]
MTAAQLSLHRMSIDGELVTASATLEVIDPATAAPFATVPDCSREQLESAVKAAQRAFTKWGAEPFEERRRLVNAFIEAVVADVETLASLITHEQGKPLAKAKSEINSAVFFSRGYAALDLAPQVLRDTATQRVELRRRPLGVVGAITAWNYPVLLAMWKIVPAVLAGNTVVLKPSPYTPLATLRLGELAQKVFPRGVVNVVSGGNALGAWMTEHPGIRKIAFTGSGPTGKRIMASAAGNLKRLTLELGGNDAGIVLADADPAKVAADLFWAKFSNCGQVCAALKRMYVHRSVYAKVCEELVKFAATVKIGNGMEEGMDIGPIQNKAQYDLVHAMVDEALEAGAEVLYRSPVPAGPGLFLPITILTNVTPAMRVVKEEVFGPVLTITPYDDEEDALRWANETEYGLGGSVWGSDIEHAAGLAARLDSGGAWVNQHPAMGPDIPFGGVKGSGLGVELGQLGLEEYTSVQVLNVKLGG